MTCDTTPDATFINTTVTSVDAVLSGLFSSPPLSSEVIAVLELVCDQSGTAYPSLIQIDALVAACPELLNVTNLPTLHVGSLSVAGLISTFGNVSNFCGIATSFACVLDVSAQSGFINCIDAAPTACARRDCVMTYMNTTCPSDMSIAYIYAAEAIHTGTISLNTCDSAGGVTASITLILMAAICSMFL
ncbi:hypothetical protein ACF0H5_012086 [Mactra antiquata]